MTTTIMSVKKVSRCSVNIQAQFLPDLFNPVGATLQTGTTTYVVKLQSGNITTTTRSLNDSSSFPGVAPLQIETSMTPADGLPQLWELAVTTVDVMV